LKIVDGGGALDGFQKIFDQNGPGRTIIKNFCTANSSIVLRTCGDCGLQYTRHVNVRNSKFIGPGLTIIGKIHFYYRKFRLKQERILNTMTKYPFIMFLSTVIMTKKLEWLMHV